MCKNKIKVLVRGGMGNQMFQAAFGKVLAIKFNVDIEFIDITSIAPTKRYWSLYCFGLEPKKIGKKIKFILLLRIYLQRLILRFFPGALFGVLIEQKEFTSPILNKTQPSLVNGYWQCRKFFENYNEEIKSYFNFPEIPLQTNILQQVKTKLPIVAIHIRRGDFVSKPTAKSIHLVCTPEWYIKAWAFIKEELGDCQAVIYSDDIDWVKKNIQLDGKIHYAVNNKEEWIDMANISKCNHFIISNSTFSWWAAFLGETSESIVIAPKEWLIGKKTIDIDICPKSWVLM